VVPATQVLVVNGYGAKVTDEIADVERQFAVINPAFRGVPLLSEP
jgi:hypothetical protein